MNKDEIEIGMKVDYCPNINEPPVKMNCVVESDPWQISHIDWVVLIDGVDGRVLLNTLVESE